MKSTRAVVLAVIFSTFFVGFGGGVVFPILPNLGVLLGISAFMVGLILSANRFVRIVANAPSGALVDRIGTRTPFILGLFIEAVATMGYIVALWASPAELWFLLARVLWGFGSALVFATAYTIAADVSSGTSRGKNMGIVRGGMMLGFPAGLVLGGVISEVVSIAAAFATAAAFAVVAGVIAYGAVPETHVAETNVAVKPWHIERSIPALTVGFVNFGLYFAYLGALFATLVLFLPANDLTINGLGAQASSGILMGVTVIAASVFMLSGGILSDRLRSRVPVLLTFLVVSFIGFVTLAHSSTVWQLVAACLFIGAGQGGTSGPMMALLADLTPEDRMGRAVGTNNVLGDLGGGIGPVISLPLLEVIGFEPIYLACAFIPLLAGIVLMVGMYRETGRITPRVTYSVDQ